MRTVGYETWKYITVEDSYINTFNYAAKLCRDLGGSLPFIHSQEDLDFLTDTVIGKDSPGDTTTWIGLNMTNHSCSEYLDGSPVNYDFSYYDDGAIVIILQIVGQSVLSK